MLFDFLFLLVSLQFCTDLYVVRVPMPLGPTSVLCGSLCCPGFYVTWSHVPIVWVPILSQYLCHLVSPLCCMGLYVVRVSMSLGLNYVLYVSLCCPCFYVTWSHFRSAWVSMLSVFLCHLVSRPLCMYLYVVRVSMSLGLTSVLYVSLCCPCFYVTWSHVRSVCISMLSVFLCHLASRPLCMYLYVVRVSMSLGLTSVLYVSLCCPCFYVTWSHVRYVCISMLSVFLCHLVSRPFCMYLYVVRVSMSLGLTSVMYVSLCCPCFYVTWSHVRSVCISMLSVFLCHLVSRPFCMYLYVVRLSMSLGLTSVLYVSLCCPCFYVTWSHVRSVCISMLSVFLCHLVSRPFCMYLYVVRVSMSLGLTSVLYVSMLSVFLCHLVSRPFCMYLYVVRVSMSLGLTSVLYVSMLSVFLCHLVSRPFCMHLYVVRVSMSLGLTSVLYVSLCCPCFYVTWSHVRSVCISMLSVFLCHLVSRPFCMYLYVVRVSMSLGLTSVLYVSLCCPCFYVTWSHVRSVCIYVVRVSMSLGLTSVLYASLCCPCFYVTWSHVRSVCISMLSVFLCHLVSRPFCMYLYVVRVSMSLGLTSVLYVSLCCPCFYVTWSHVRSVCISMLSVFLCHLVSRPFCMYLYVVRVSMSLGLTSVLYVSLCCPCFYVTWSHVRSVCISMLSVFLCHLVSRPFCMYLYVVRVSMSLGLTSVLYVSLCCPCFYVTWSHVRSVCIYVVRVSMSLGLTSVLYVSLCCPCFYVTWSHVRSVCIYVVRVSMSLGLTSVLYASLCCPCFYVTWSHVRCVCISMLSVFLCHLVSRPFCMYLYVVRVSMSLGLTSVLYVSLCCPCFYVTWSHVRSVCISMLSVFLCHLVSRLFCMYLYVVRVSMSLGLTSVLYVYLCCLGFYILPLCSCDYVTFTTNRSLFSKISFELSVILSL